MLRPTRLRLKRSQKEGKVVHNHHERNHRNRQAVNRLIEVNRAHEAALDLYTNRNHVPEVDQTHVPGVEVGLDLDHEAAQVPEHLAHVRGAKVRIVRVRIDRAVNLVHEAAAAVVAEAVVVVEVEAEVAAAVAHGIAVAANHDRGRVHVPDRAVDAKAKAFPEAAADQVVLGHVREADAPVEVYLAAVEVVQGIVEVGPDRAHDPAAEEAVRADPRAAVEVARQRFGNDAQRL